MAIKEVMYIRVNVPLFKQESWHIPPDPHLGWSATGDAPIHLQQPPYTPTPQTHSGPPLQDASFGVNLFLSGVPLLSFPPPSYPTF